MRIDPRVLIDTFDYYPYSGQDKYHKPNYGAKQEIKRCRIDRRLSYQIKGDEENKLYAIIFCYSSDTTPFPAFKRKSKVTVDGEERIISEVIPVYHPYANRLFAYELEVI